jgi:large exoprotein involved in heme utilization and adhesion
MVEAHEIKLNRGRISSSQSSNNTHAIGNAGTVMVTGRDIEVRNGGQIASSTSAQGNAGTVMVTGRDIEVRNGGKISSNTRSRSQTGTGTVTVNATDHLFISGDGAQETGITSETEGTSTSAAGSVTVKAGFVELRDGGRISSDTQASGHAGTVNVEADRLVISADGSKFSTGIISDAHTGSGKEGKANAGSVTVKAGELELNGGRITSDTRASGDAGTVMVTGHDIEVHNAGQIGSDTSASGNAGTVTVIATDLLVVNGDGAQSADGTPRLTGISSSQSSDDRRAIGNAGSVTVEAGVLELRNGGKISSNTQAAGQAGTVSVEVNRLFASGDGFTSLTGISSATGPGSTGSGGALEIRAHTIQLRDGSTVSTESQGSGGGGSIKVTINDSLLLDNATIKAQTTTAGGGDVTVVAGRLFDLHDSQVTTSVAGGTGSGGNIFINSPLMVIDNSQIIANAQRGAGGNITIQAGQLIRTPDSVIQASSELGLSGTISIAAPNTDVVSSLVVLPETFLDASSQLREACAARGGRPGSSFNAGGRGGLPPDPGTPLAASPFGQPLEQQTATGSLTTSTPRPPQAAEPVLMSGIPQPVLGSPRLTCRG